MLAKGNLLLDSNLESRLLFWREELRVFHRGSGEVLLWRISLWWMVLGLLFLKLLLNHLNFVFELICSVLLFPDQETLVVAGTAALLE